jgi:hypothetical protein
MVSCPLLRSVVGCRESGQSSVVSRQGCSIVGCGLVDCQLSVVRVSCPWSGSDVRGQLTDSKAPSRPARSRTCRRTPCRRVSDWSDGSGGSGGEGRMAALCRAAATRVGKAPPPFSESLWRRTQCRGRCVRFGESLAGVIRRKCCGWHPRWDCEAGDHSRAPTGMRALPGCEGGGRDKKADGEF